MREPGDWTRLEVLDPSAGVLGEQIEALRLIAKGLEGRVPFLMTVFTPLSIAARLVPSEEMFLEHLREHPESVRQALEVVTETFVRFTNACLDVGASGLFYATTSWATTDLLTLDEYAALARPYDLRVLEAASGAEFNLLHVCKDNNMPRRARRLPCARLQLGRPGQRQSLPCGGPVYCCVRGLWSAGCPTRATSSMRRRETWPVTFGARSRQWAKEAGCWGLDARFPRIHLLRTSVQLPMPREAFEKGA